MSTRRPGPVGTLTVVWLEGAEATAFLDEDTLVSVVWANDGMWRGEYFNSAIEYFGIAVKEPEVAELSMAQKAELRRRLAHFGVAPEDVVDL